MDLLVSTIFMDNRSDYTVKIITIPKARGESITQHVMYVNGAKRTLSDSGYKNYLKLALHRMGLKVLDITEIVDTYGVSYQVKQTKLIKSMSDDKKL